MKQEDPAVRLESPGFSRGEEVKRIVFLDTETTSLRPDREVWDVGMIVREPGVYDDHEVQLFVESADLDLGNADLMSLRIGRFYERHPEYASSDRYVTSASMRACQSAARVAKTVEWWTRGAHIVGAVPNFDTEVLGNLLGKHKLLPAWHYHLVDIETLIVGWLAYKRRVLREQHPEVNLVPPSLPWKSDDLFQAVGVGTPAEEDRHTALGDARVVRDAFDAVHGGAL